jgi:hypothetical protein
VVTRRHAISGGDKLRWLKDLSARPRRRLPWKRRRRARRWGVAAPTGLILARSREVLAAPIPAWVPAQLLGAGSTRLVRLVERASPWELSVGRLTAASHVVSRSISQGPVVHRSGSFGGFRSLDPREPAASSPSARGAAIVGRSSTPLYVRDAGWPVPDSRTLEDDRRPRSRLNRIGNEAHGPGNPRSEGR